MWKVFACRHRNVYEENGLIEANRSLPSSPDSLSLCQAEGCSAWLLSACRLSSSSYMIMEWHCKLTSSSLLPPRLVCGVALHERSFQVVFHEGVLGKAPFVHPAALLLLVDYF